MGSAKAARQLGAQDWIKAGLRQLASSGIDAVRVERLAAALKVTKGSFYWHFKDLAALRAELLAAWEQSTTAAIIARIDAIGGDPRQRAGELARIVFGEEGALERQVRAWAAQDAAAAAVQERVDRRRIAYVEALFVDGGLSGDVARSRAVFLYHALIGHFTLGRQLQLSPGEIDDLIALLFGETPT